MNNYVSGTADLLRAVALNRSFRIEVMRGDKWAAWSTMLASRAECAKALRLILAQASGSRVSRYRIVSAF